MTNYNNMKKILLIDKIEELEQEIENIMSTSIQLLIQKDKEYKVLFNKSIPTKILKSGLSCQCPNCFTDVEEIENYCCHCGQALDWRDIK